jgi:hypothetical protein
MAARQIGGLTGHRLEKGSIEPFIAIDVADCKGSNSAVERRSAMEKPAE